MLQHGRHREIRLLYLLVCVFACLLVAGQRALALPEDATSDEVEAVATTPEEQEALDEPAGAMEEGAPDQTESDEPARAAPDQDELPARESFEHWEWENEQEADLLPGWGYDINSWEGAYSVYVDDGTSTQNLPYTVTGVEVSDNSDDAIVLYSPVSAGEAWHIEARQLGTATLTVTYRKPMELGGEEDSYTMTINVTEEVYNLNAFSTDGSYKALPGESQEYDAFGWVDTFDPDTHEYGHSEEGLTFVWSFADSYSGTLATMQQDGSSATVQALSQENGDPFENIAFLTVTMVRDDEELATAETRLIIANPYVEIEPTDIDSDLAVGVPTVVEPKLMKHELDNSGSPKQPEQLNVLDWEWMYDDLRLQIENNNDGTYTITRLTPSDTFFGLMCRYETAGGEQIAVDTGYHLNGMYYGLWFDYDSDRVYSDGTLGLSLETENPLPDSVTVTFTIGVWDDDDWVTTFDDKSGCFYFDEDSGDLILVGEALYEQLQQYDTDDLCVHAEACVGDYVLANCDAWINVREARVEYELPDDRTMLPDWEDGIDRWNRMWADTAEHPDMEDQYEITDVYVDTEEIWDGNRTGSVVSVTYDEEDHWQIRAMGYGEANMIVKYNDVHNEEQTWSYTITVDSDVYNVDVWTEGPDRALPGHSIILHAEGWHDADYDFDESSETLVYEWELEEWAQDWATLTVDPDDPQKAVVTFADMPEGWDEMRFDFEAEVRLFVEDASGEIIQDEDGNPIVFAEDHQHLKIESDYFEIWPTELPRRLNVGGTVANDFEVRHYAYDNSNPEGYSPVTVDEDDWEWSYDEDCVEISGEDNRFTIKRLREWGTDLRLTASFEMPWGYETVEQHYWLENLNYDVRLETDQGTVYGDGTLDVHLEGDDFADMGLDVDFEIIGWGDGIDDEPIPNDVGAYEVSDDRVTLNGGKLVELGYTGVSVSVVVSYNGEELGRSERTVEVREAYEDYEQRWGRAMIPGWWFDIDPRYVVNVGNTEYPDGLDDPWYDITSVVLRSQEQWEDNTGNVVEITEKSAEEGGGWRVTSVGYGRAIISVSYKDIHGATQRWEPLEVVVAPDVYGMFLSAENGDERFFPGTTVALHAEGWHIAVDDSIPTDDEYVFEWELRGDDYWATAEVDPNDDSRFLVTFRDLDNPREGIWRDYDAEATMFLKDPVTGEKATDDEGDPIELYRRSYHLVLGARFSELHPLGVDPNMPTFIPFEVTPELRWYDYSYTGESDPANRYDIVEGTEYTWEYDPAQMTIEPNDDGTYSITRLSPADIDFTLVGTREDGARFERFLWFDDLGYDYDLGNATVTGVMDKVYNGQEQTQDNIVVTIETDEGVKTLTEGTDYVVQYYNNVNPGNEAAVLIKAPWMDEGEVDPSERHTYGGRQVVTFAIMNSSMEDAVISPIATQNYTGKALTPKPTVTFGKLTLTEGVDYTLSYRNNARAGTATVTVTGRGVFTGSKSATFTIREVWVRRSGQVALDTMQAIAGEFGKASVAIVTTNADFKDALAASCLAGRHNALVLTTPKGEVAKQTRAALKAAGVKTVYLVGSTADVTAATEKALKSGTGVTKVVRISGASPSAKAVAVARACGKQSDTVIIATQGSFKDALSIAPYSYATKSPILYAEGNKSLSSATLKYIKDSKFSKAIIVGGPVALPASIDSQLTKSGGIAQKNITRLAGGDSYATSEVIARWATGQYANGQTVGTYQGKPLAYVRSQPAARMSANRLAVATSQGWKDALCGSALCGKSRSVLLLADDKTAKSNWARACGFCSEQRASVTRAYVFGGTSAVSARVWDALLASTAL